MKSSKVEFFSVSELELSYTRPNRGRPAMIYVRLVGVENDDGITPGRGLALALTLDEARGLAIAIAKKAAEAEARKAATPSKPSPSR
jgi:hypothetical protein